MPSVNRVFLLGNLARDPDTRHSADGVPVTRMTIATERHWKDKSSGEAKKVADFHDVVCFDRLAEIAGEYLSKGRPVHVEGRLQTRKWEDKEGNVRYSTEVIADDIQLLGTPPHAAELTEPAAPDSAPVATARKVRKGAKLAA